MAEKFNTAEYMATLQGRLTRIVVDESYLTINVDDHYQYEIALNRINNPVKILQCARTKLRHTPQTIVHAREAGEKDSMPKFEAARMPPWTPET